MKNGGKGRSNIWRNSICSFSKNKDHSTVEVADRFKELDLIDRVPDKGSQHRTGGGDQNHPQGEEMQKGKVVV